MRMYFGTDGVRGVANQELTPELAFSLGKAGGYVLTKETDNPLVVIGKDTRLSGDLLESAMIAGLLSVGVHVKQLGIVPTPAVAYLTRECKAAAGIMISASHNPFQDNGIKFFNHQGFKLSDQTEEEIEYYITHGNEIPLAGSERIGTVSTHSSGQDMYIEFLKKTVTQSFKSQKVVIDCANGASSFIAKKLFTSLGAEVVLLAHTPTGTNINVQCGSTHPEALQSAVVSEKASMGFALDGDADRLIAVDENGNLVDGDGILYVLSQYLKSNDQLKKNTVVSTVMSNFGFAKALEKTGIDTVQTDVGDRYVLENMRENGYTLGGEQSGHIVFLEHNTTGDGLLSAIQLLEVVVTSGKTLSTLASPFISYPQQLLNVRVKDKKNWETNHSILEIIKSTTESLNGNGRVLVRASGTEQLIRVMAEGETADLVNQVTQQIADVVRKELA